MLRDVLAELLQQLTAVPPVVIALVWNEGHRRLAERLMALADEEVVPVAVVIPRPQL